MWEVFDYKTGETIGFCEYRATAAIYCANHSDRPLDYLHECQNPGCNGQTCRPQP